LKPLANKIHLLTGALAFLIFLFTGYYMRYRIPHLVQSTDRMRFSMRGNHIYILLLALLNLSLGAYLKASAVSWRAILQRLGSGLILVGTGLVIFAFFRESKEGLDRPFTLLAMASGLAGTFFHLFSVMKGESSGE
jgi:hypothetical protein